MSPVDVREPTPAGVESSDSTATVDRASHRRGSSMRDQIGFVGLVIVLVAPLVVAMIALRSPTWYPVLDLAMTEFRLRDVGTSQTPLIGLPGRIGRTIAQQGSHPGPMSFYALAPTYKLFGSTAWAMQAATVVVHAIAIGASLAVARRRGGFRLMVGVSAVLAVLARSYGLSILTEPWNPYLPVLLWFLFLLAVWSVLDDDVAMLPVAVAAGSFCAQTHVPYLPITIGLGAVAAIGAGFAYRRRTLQRDRAVVARWVAASLALGVLLWLPPLIDQAIREPGNLSRLAAHFTDPPEPPVGYGEGVQLAFEHLDLTTLASERGSAGWTIRPSDNAGSAGPALVLVALWAVAAAVALRSRHRSVISLHVVVAVALALGVIAMGRIFGNVWYYLTLWHWGVTALLVLAVAYTATVSIGRRKSTDAPVSPAAMPVSAGRSPRWALGTVLLSAITVLSSLLFAIDALDAPPPAPRLSSALGSLIDPTVQALELGVVGSRGRDGRYVVTWADALHIGSQAYGLVSELERRGFEVGMTHGLSVPLTPHRVVDPKTATTEIHFATGVNIEPFRQLPGVVEVATVDPRSPSELAEFRRLRTQAINALESDGLFDVVPLVDSNLFSASIGARVPTATRKVLGRMLDLGEPAAVFLAPPGTSRL